MGKIMKTHWNTQISVGEFVTDNALCAETFEDLSINFVLEGTIPLKGFARKKALNLKEY